MPEITNDREVLEMALAGYALKLSAIENEIERVRVLLALGGSNPPARETRETRGHRHLSAEGRARIGAAARKRWARVRREKRKGGRG